MTGPEHYRQAERLLAAVAGGIPGDVLAQSVLRAEMIGRAQAHATLAGAAAMGTYGATLPGASTRSAADDEAWAAVAGP